MLPPQFFGSIEYYALMSAFGKVYINNDIRFDKRFKSVHRTTIADTHGVTSLTIPISKPKAGEPTYSALRWRDIGLSSHGRWWNVYLETLASAYGRTPFFEFYIDRFKPFFSETAVTSFPDITALDEALNRLICDILYIDVTYVDNPLLVSADFLLDSREKLAAAEAAVESVEYYQLRAAKHGFIPHMSILDLIFNIGPEAPLYISSLKQ